jgi:hypothetical protein
MFFFTVLRVTAICAVRKTCGSYWQMRFEIANHPYHDWQCTITAEVLVEQHQTHSLFSAFQRFVRRMVRATREAGMICKDNNLFHYAHYIRAQDPSAKFIYLYRDARAYCASWKGVPAMHKTTYQNARHWAAEQTVCLNLSATHGIDHVSVAYEELVSNTPVVVDRIFAHVGIESDTNCYQTAAGKNDEAATRNEFWKNINKPVFDRGAEGYRKKLECRRNCDD